MGDETRAKRDLLYLTENYVPAYDWEKELQHRGAKVLQAMEQSTENAQALLRDWAKQSTASLELTPTPSFFGRWCDLRMRQEQRDVLFRFRQVFFERLAGSPIAVPEVVHGVPEAVQVLFDVVVMMGMDQGEMPSWAAKTA